MATTAFNISTHGPARQAVQETPVIAEGCKRHMKRKNGNVQKQILARCAGQTPACEAFVQTLCSGDASCVAAVTPCCEPLQTCDFASFVTCFRAATL
jgi:hypothetical protein